MRPFWFVSWSRMKILPRTFVFFLSNFGLSVSKSEGCQYPFVFFDPAA